MKYCPNCRTECQDQAAFCPNCGFNFQQGTMPHTTVDPKDHTAEFDPRDISDNKVYCMVIYLLGWIGILIALIAANNSRYVAFHVRQGLKFQVVSVLLGIVTLLLCWTVIVPIAAGVCYIILFILQIIAFFQICGGKAKEPAIIASLDFLK